ncbi:SGNH hydrolase-type esterase domain-containing protein [Aspergillus keveii]|uniref:SGNH hydrolase-type esterase domain-containing protein n=1 Tax=Aspergillus keveii TaxID=714993 RepID=A0ABR4FI90_9EURO
MISHWIVGLLLLIQRALSYPVLPVYNVTGHWLDPDEYKRLTPRQDLEVALRVLSLGASITFGSESTDGNGYRKALRDAMRYAGHPVNMVGSQVNGNMRDNNNEGWPGATVREVHDKVRSQYRLQPNLVLINAGTNDCTRPEEPLTAPGRMEAMVEDIFNNVPDVTIILSGLMPNSINNVCTKLLNNAYGQIVDRLAARGRKIVFADTYNGYITMDDLHDGTHPHDFGYQKFAAVWWHAFTEASGNGWITTPKDNGLPDGTSNVNGDGLDELVLYNEPGEYEAWFPDPVFQHFRDPIKRKFSVPDGCNPPGVRWGDVNGDGLDDFICIGPEGNMYVSVNRGSSGDYGSAPAFEYLTPAYHENPLRGTRSQTHVRLGDIDGDGRLDYCLIHDNGDIECWRNGWIWDHARWWEHMGIVFTGKNKGNIDGVRFIDINGDHRDDWLYVEDDGAVDTYINTRGHDQSLRPDWRHAGITHQGMDTAGVREDIRFARLSNSGRRDYTYSTYTGLGFTTRLLWWKNEGGGGTELKSDGNFYCDMTGDGFDDYISVSKNGQYTLYRNINDPPNWGQDGVIFNQYWDRRRVRIADIDGDKRCDIIFLGVDGTVYMWYRNEFEDDNVSFHPMGGIQELPPCPQRDGVGQFDLAFVFADLNGDRKADRLCIDPDGRAFGYFSTPTGYKNMNQVKKPEDKNRANLRWVDVNGDGKADMVWLDKFGGDAYVWYNEKEEPAPGTASSMIWRSGGPAYRQSARGEAIHFADLTNNGRMDMIDVTPQTNIAHAWLARPCSNDGSDNGGDDGPPAPPNLPSLVPPISFPKFDRFFAMGDSYSAGIGAGNRLQADVYDPADKCRRNDGAYSYQLWQREPDLRPPRNFAFISCSGAETKHMLSDRGEFGRPPQLEILQTQVNQPYAWGTLSIGGNDVGFSNIAKYCLILQLPWPANCNNYIEYARRRIVGDGQEAQDFERRLELVYSGILNTAQTEHFTLVVTGYAKFFNDQTSVCDSATFNDYILGPSLTKDLRRMLNILTDQLNAKIKRVVEKVDSQFPNKYVRFYDIDPQFEGHRFCDVDEQGNERPHPDWKKEAWFLTVAGSDMQPDGTVVPVNDNHHPDSVDLRTIDVSTCPEPDLNADAYTFACLFARQIQENPDFEFVGEGDGADLIMPMLESDKAFHPKAIAHSQTVAGIKRDWLRRWGYYVPGTT